MSNEICPDCKHFIAYDEGLKDTLTMCNKIGDFEGVKKACHDFEKQITVKDLLREIDELKKENRLLKQKLKK